MDSYELNNLDPKPKLINQSQQSNENNNFNSISGLITGMEISLPEKTLAHLSDNLSNNYEISRIHSLKKPVYSVSTIATQADMDRGTILAERKDYKYRNQDMSDVESQILSIEVDCYASMADWCSGKLNENLKVLSPRSKELASVTVNDYVAFKNCLNFQLQAAKAMACQRTTDLNDTQLSTEFNSDSQPFKNRMIVRIASVCSNKSQENTEVDQNLPKLIYEAYQNALAACCSTNTRPEDLLKSFQNNLYMQLDAIPNFKSIQGSLINSKEFVENFLKLSLKSKESQLKQSSTLNTILDESVDSSRLEESFLKCLEANRGKKRKRKNQAIRI